VTNIHSFVKILLNHMSNLTYNISMESVSDTLEQVNEGSECPNHVRAINIAFP